MAEPRRLAVLGSPIAHSRSPQLHLAAYRVLALDWRYERIELQAAELPAFVDVLGPEWLGLSLTMPLKRAAYLRAGRRHPLVAATGLANTLLLDGRGGAEAFNTDVAGITDALAAAGAGRVRRAVVVGGGATGRSALAALAGLDAEVVVLARNPAKVAADPRFAEAAEPFELRPLDELASLVEGADVVVSTVPGGFRPAALPRLGPGNVLLDVVYEPWPTPFAEAWAAAGGGLASGLEMLLRQAVAQVRVFVGGDQGLELDREAEVLDAMRAALGDRSDPRAVGGS